MFDRPINIEHKQIPKMFLQLMRIFMAHNIFKGFLVFSSADIYFFFFKKKALQKP